jgi:transposase
MIVGTPQTLLDGAKRDDINRGVRDGVSNDERERIRALEREVKELRRASEILKVASAFFAQAELGHRFKLRSSWSTCIAIRSRSNRLVIPRLLRLRPTTTSNSELPLPNLH